MQKLRIGLGILAVLCTSLLRAAEWGHLQGRFLYGGEPPARKPLTITADKEFCGKHEILEEQLVVNSASRGVANVFVWLFLARGQTLPAIHESYVDTAKAEVLLDASGCRFEPHACLLRTTQTLLIRNRNPIGDSAKIDTLANPPLNILLPIKSESRQQYPAAERLPVHVSCSLHPWESGWLLIKEHPYVAISQADGTFAIRNIPCGRWTFQFWHEQAGYVTQAKVGGRLADWPRGRVELEIQAGGHDLGVMVLAPSLFAK